MLEPVEQRFGSESPALAFHRQENVQGLAFLKTGLPNDSHYPLPIVLTAQIDQNGIHHKSNVTILGGKRESVVVHSFFDQVHRARGPKYAMSLNRRNACLMADALGFVQNVMLSMTRVSPTDNGRTQ